MSHQAVEEFLAEVEDLLERLNQDLASLGEGADTGQANPDLLNGIFRQAHSIKGLAGMFGFDDVAELAHHLENLLDHLRLGKIPLNHPLIDCLFDTLEGLAGLVKGKAVNPEFTQDISPYLTRIEHLLSGPTAAPEDLLTGLNIEPGLLEVLTEYEEHRLLENLKQGKSLLLVKVAFSLMTFDTELVAATEILKDNGEVISTLPGAAADNPELLAFRILCGSYATPEELKSKIPCENLDVDLVAAGRKSATETPPAAAAPAQKKPEVKPKLKPEPSAEPMVKTRPAGRDGSAEQGGQEEGDSARSFTSSVRVDIGKLDYLMNIVGELALAKGAISQIGKEMEMQGVPQARELGKAVHALERRLNDLQAGVMDVRMVPVRQLFEKMNRIIRKMAFELGKKVKLEIRGGDTELDKLIVEDLADPLMHIIRNSLDHGIEPHKQRRASGKDETGTLSLMAMQKGNHVVISVKDDGKGIDSDLLRQKGIEKGLITTDSNPNRQELFGLLFHPGFSTRDEVSEYSGRGVGMDVVKNNISSLSGLIEIDSEAGKGTVISLTLPITLAIIKALVIRVKDVDYAIPLHSVLETLMLEPGMVQTIEGREVMELRKQTLSLLRIEHLFQLSGQSSAASQFVVVAGFSDKRVGFIVDELCGQQDVVIKSLGKALSFVKGIAGAADLGNQKTILVLDVSGLIGDVLNLEGTVGV